MEVMNSWKVLGIEKGAERTDIKRAYARLVKQFHPEDDPEGFTRIRTAETVLIELEMEQDSKPTTCDFTSNISIKKSAYGFIPLQQWDEAELAKKISIVIGRMADIYEIIEFRRDRNNWEICFHLETYKAIMPTEQFALAFLTFLDSHRNFPCHMWRYFHAETNLLNLLSAHTDIFPDLRNTVTACVFEVPIQYCSTFDYLRSDTPPEILEQYIEKMLALQLHFARKNSTEAFHGFQELTALIDNDLELYEISANYFLENGMKEETEKICKLALAKWSDAENILNIMTENSR